MINWYLDGYGIYVWPAYAATLCMVGIFAVRAYLRYKNALRGFVKSRKQSYVP